MADARRAIESSADFTRGGTPPVPDHDASERQRAERIEAEQRRLVAWAKEHGKLGGRLPKDDVGGGEHIVRLDEKADRVFKATQLGKHKGYGIALGSYTHGAPPRPNTTLEQGSDVRRRPQAQTTHGAHSAGTGTSQSLSPNGAIWSPR